jgi:hypothetical protein
VLRVATFYIPITPGTAVNTESKQTTFRRGLKKKSDSPPRRSLREIIQQGAGSSGAPLRGLVATSKPAVEISAEGRDEPVVRNLPDVKPGIRLLGVSATDIPLQGASIFGMPTAGEGLGHLVSRVGRHPDNAFFARRKLKKAKARASEAGTGGIQQPGNAGAHKQEETLTETLKRPRSDGSTRTETARPPKRPTRRRPI